MDINIRAVEKSGSELKNKLFRPDLNVGEPFGKPNCLMDMVGDVRGGCSNHKAGALYKAVCTLCEKEGVTAEYIGESGDSG